MWKMKPLAVGMLEVNCYIIAETESAHVWVIDPGEEADRIIKGIRELVPEPTQVQILLTHAHVDHIGAVGRVAKAFDAPVFLHPNDEPLYRSPANALPPFLPQVKDLPDTQTPESTADYQVIPTPGHTQGGVCYLFPQINTLFTGDTLFAGSVGRTDLPGGNPQHLMDSIRNRLLVLPASLHVAPGHGPTSTIGHESESNPYLHFSQY